VTETPWYIEQAERAAWEVERLEALDLMVKREEDGLVLRLHTSVGFHDENLPIAISFPADYPEAPPSVHADRLVLERHQERVDFGFCLLANPETDWNPRRVAAELIVLLLQMLRDTEAGSEAVARGEAEMPEPASAYYRHVVGVAALVTEPFLIREIGISGGTMSLSFNQAGNTLLLRKAEGLGVAPTDLIRRFGDKKQPLRGMWFAVDVPPNPAQVQSDVLQLLGDRTPSALPMLVRRRRTARGRDATLWVGVTFIEEGPTLGEQRRTWVFFEISANKRGAPRVKRIAQAQALTKNERARRIPELRHLRDLRVLVVGAGSLGGSVALELAKAGVGSLDVVDRDIYDVNNAVRHVGPVAEAGLAKGTVVARQCRSLNPFTESLGHYLYVGSSEEADREALKELVAAADIVVDTTGSQVVTRVIQKHCRAAGRQLVVVGLTAGSHGGEIVILSPNGACFDCFVLHQADTTIPEPTRGSAHFVTPIGCRHPAFSGAGFDATSLAADATRAVVRATGSVGYPPLDFDWGISNFRAQPRWQQGVLRPHPDCHRRH